MTNSDDILIVSVGGRLTEAENIMNEYLELIKTKTHDLGFIFEAEKSTFVDFIKSS